MNVDPTEVSEGEFRRHVFQRAVAHELGHILGFSHDFSAKNFIDPKNPDAITASVMDYHHPTDIVKIHDLGPRDYALVKYLYLDGGDTALQGLRTFPFCSDGDKATDPGCNPYARRQMSPQELLGWYTEHLSSALPELEHRVGLGVLAKLLLTQGAAATEPSWHEVIGFMGRSGKQDLFLYWFEMAAAANAKAFNALDPQIRKEALWLMAELVYESNPFHPSLDHQKRLVSLIAMFGDMVAYRQLQLLDERIQEKIQSASDPDQQTILMRLQSHLRAVIGRFWT